MLQNADNSYAGTAGHFDVLRRVPNINATAGLKAKLVNCKQELHGMRLAMGYSVAEDTGGKKWLQPKSSNLRANPPAAAAADQPQLKPPCKRLHYMASAGVQQRALGAIESTP